MDNIAREEFDIATEIEKNLWYRVAKRGKNVDIKGLFSNTKSKASTKGLILGGKDMQILNVWPDIEDFFFDIKYKPSIFKAHDDKIK